MRDVCICCSLFNNPYLKIASVCWMYVCEYGPTLEYVDAALNPWRQQNNRRCSQIFGLFVLASWLVRWARWLRKCPAPQSHLAPAAAAADRWDSRWTVRLRGTQAGSGNRATHRGQHGGDKAQDLSEGHQVPVRGLGRVGAASSCANVSGRAAGSG